MELAITNTSIILRGLSPFEYVNPLEKQLCLLEKIKAYAPFFLSSYLQITVKPN